MCGKFTTTDLIELFLLLFIEKLDLQQLKKDE